MSCFWRSYLENIGKFEDLWKWSTVRSGKSSTQWMHIKVQCMNVETLMYIEESIRTHIPHCWVLASLLGDLDWVPSPWLWPVPALAVASIWQMNQRMEAVPVCLSERKTNILNPIFQPPARLDRCFRYSRFSASLFLLILQILFHTLASFFL